MANIKSAAKRAKQASIRNKRNRQWKDRIKKAEKTVLATKTNKGDAKEALKQLQKSVDKAAKKNVISKRKAGRMKSRLARSTA